MKLNKNNAGAKTMKKRSGRLTGVDHNRPPNKKTMTKPLQSGTMRNHAAFDDKTAPKRTDSTAAQCNKTDSTEAMDSKSGESGTTCSNAYGTPKKKAKRKAKPKNEVLGGK